MLKNTLILTSFIFMFGCSPEMWSEMNINNTNGFVVSKQSIVWVKDVTGDTPGVLLVRDETGVCCVYSSPQNVVALVNILPKEQKEIVKNFVGRNGVRNMGEMNRTESGQKIIEMQKKAYDEFCKKYPKESKAVKDTHGNWAEWPLWTNFVLDYIVRNWERK